MVTSTGYENGSRSVPENIEVVYGNPFQEATPRKSQAWFNLRALYLSYKVELKVSNVEGIVIDSIQRNEKDGGRWRWDTPLFQKEVDELIASIRSTNKFEAVWLKEEDGILSLLDGHHRVVAWQQMGNSTIPAVVIKATPYKSQFQWK